MFRCPEDLSQRPRLTHTFTKHQYVQPTHSLLVPGKEIRPVAGTLEVVGGFGSLGNYRRQRCVVSRDDDQWSVASEDLDAQFGHTDRWSLDVLALRAEILSERGGFEDQVEAEAAAIVERAVALQGENDGWQRLYNLVRGWFFLGQAQFRMGKREDALASLHTALGFAEEFRMIDESDIFEPERAVIAGYLETL